MADAACEPQSSGFTSSLPQTKRTTCHLIIAVLFQGPGSSVWMKGPMDGMCVGGTGWIREVSTVTGTAEGSNEGPGYCGYVSGCPVLVCALHIPCPPLFLSLLFPPSAELVFLLPLVFFPLTPPPLCPLKLMSLILQPAWIEQGFWLSHQFSWAVTVEFVSDCISCSAEMCQWLRH